MASRGAIGLAFGASLIAGPVVAQPTTTANGSSAVQATAAWAAADAGGKAFAVVDKIAAKVYVFVDGRLAGAAAVLLGLARGDDSSPGIGNRPLSAIRPAERTTPAGRFEARPDINLAGHRILWLDYDAAVSMHAVVTGNKSERRLQRLETASTADNRISYGCINVPADFFANVVEPAFKAGGIVYVLPEVRPFADVLPKAAEILSGHR